jgi:hypothetical protein
MGRIVLCLASMTTMAVALAGCGFADSHAVLPDFMRTKVSEAPLQPVPDVKQLVREHLDSVFTAASRATCRFRRHGTTSAGPAGRPASEPS